MGLNNNNITIYQNTGFSPSFNWQVGINNPSLSIDNLTFRATIRPLNGLEQYNRIPSNNILYEETGILINSVTQLGEWSFPLSTNAAISGGPYRDYQVVIEGHDTNGLTSAGNLVGTNNENGWTQFNQGYDIIAITNPRQTGIELSNNLYTQYSSTTGNTGNLLDTGFYLHSGHGYSSLNYMGTHGEINIRYLSGTFNSNIVGGYIYVWTGQFPKLDTLLGINGYDKVYKSQFNFDPNLGYVYHPTAGMPFRGSNNVYVSLSFYDNLDQEAINNGIDISTGLYLSDNAICYNDIAAGSISIGGMQSIYAYQYTGNAPATGVIPTGVNILSSTYYNGITTVLYLSNPLTTTGYNTYKGLYSNSPGGAGGNSILLNETPLKNVISSFSLTTNFLTDDSMVIYLNGQPIRDLNNPYRTDPSSFDLLSLASNSGLSIKYNDTISIYGRDNYLSYWNLPQWTATITFGDGYISNITGGYNIGATPSTGVAPVYRPNGYLIVEKRNGTGYF